MMLCNHPTGVQGTRTRLTHKALHELVLLSGLDADEVHAALPAVVPGVEPVPLVVGQPRLIAQPGDPVVVAAEALNSSFGNS